MKKVMLVFGTRPEAIKMCPIAIELKQRVDMQVQICVTGQHREMLDSVLNVFGITPDYDLHIMRERQTLFDVTEAILKSIKPVLEYEMPDVVLVHGDTTTTFAAALSCFYLNIPIGHVEAGLRTYNLHSPFPEEFNRQTVSKIAKWHFAPTKDAYNNLINENTSKENIFITGNTAIDALSYTISDKYTCDLVSGTQKLILLTAHRRENIGRPMENIFMAVKQILKSNENVVVLYPIHMNPIIYEIMHKVFSDSDQILNRFKIVAPMDVLEFHNIMKKSYMILTDSGGIQEEAPSLGKPVLVLRDTTERPEGIKAGTLKLVGTKPEDIYRECQILLHDKKAYDSMAKAVNPYGDGHAAARIADILHII